MANVTKTVPANGAWAELTPGAAPTGLFQFSNTSSYPIVVQYAAAAPAVGADGDVYQAGEGDRIADLTVRAWARVLSAGNAAKVFVHGGA